MLGGAREWKRVSVDGVNGIRSLCDINRPNMSATCGESESDLVLMCNGPCCINSTYQACVSSELVQQHKTIEAPAWFPC
jgi:hypothetical protein